MNALPASGEAFNAISACERRLRDYGLAEGFDVVQTEGGTRGHPGARWQCGHHGVEARVPNSRFSSFLGSKLN